MDIVQSRTTKPTFKQRRNKCGGLNEIEVFMDDVEVRVVKI